MVRKRTFKTTSYVRNKERRKQQRIADRHSELEAFIMPIHSSQETSHDPLRSLTEFEPFIVEILNSNQTSNSNPNFDYSISPLRSRIQTRK